MTIDKAIETLIKYEQELMLCLPTDSRIAIELSIEALKYVRYRDNCPGLNTRLLLPGETEEG